MTNGDLARYAIECISAIHEGNAKLEMIREWGAQTAGKGATK